MRILVSNDDGIHAQGLWALVKSLLPLGEVLVVAPDRDQSGVGAAVTLAAPIRAMEVSPQVSGVCAFSVQGTPSDSVILALEHLAPGPIDLLVAGINHGANLGDDIFVSGTLGAAFQGYFRGIPSIAISVGALQEPQLTAASLLAPYLVQGVMDSSLSQPFLLNVNLPNLLPTEIQGIEVTRLGRRSYADSIQVGEDGKRIWYWIRRNRPAWELIENTDIYAVREGRVSLTPLMTDLTAKSDMNTLSEVATPISKILRGR